MNVFEKRIALEDIKPGVVVWPVFSVTGSVAVVMKPAEFATKPYLCSYVGALRFDWKPGGEYHANYANDRNVKGANIGIQYNFHALFLNKEDAEAYAEMINTNALPDDLRALRDSFVEEAQERRENDNDIWN